MKLCLTSLLLASTVLAVPVPNYKQEHSPLQRLPPDATFRKYFPGLSLEIESDVAKAVTKSKRAAEQAQASADEWKQNAEEAEDEANAAMAVSKRSLFIRRHPARDSVFWGKEGEKAEAVAAKARRLKKDALQAATAAKDANKRYLNSLERLQNGDMSTTKNEVARIHELSDEAHAKAAILTRKAETVSEEATEAQATVAYALSIRSSGENIDEIANRDHTAVEWALGKERRTKREAYFAGQAAKKREAIYNDIVELHSKF